MNDFERLLHGILDGTNNFWDARYIGRGRHAPITEDLRIKAEFQSTLVAAQYNALKLTAIPPPDHRCRERRALRLCC